MNPGERELLAPVRLLGGDGRLNREAVGFTRRQLHDTSGIGRGLRALGRNKRWEYWLVTTPTHLFSLTISDVDYVGSHTVWCHEIGTGRHLERTALVPFGYGTVMPPSLAEGPAIGGSTGLAGHVQPEAPGRVAARVDELRHGTRLRAFAAEPAIRSGAAAGTVRFDVVAARTPEHEALGVVVPWSGTRFQYTVKDVARPASGWLEVDGARHRLPAGESWAILDHGRGRWPYRMWWNWGAAAGTSGGHAVGLQLGGRWTDGTGSRENAVVVDGRLHPIHEDLSWEYHHTNWLAPWRIRSESVDVSLTPFWDHAGATELGVLSMRSHQVFGHYNGRVRLPAGEVPIAGLLGFAEDVRNRW